MAALQPQTATDKHRIVEIDEACKITRKAKPTIYTLARKGLILAYKRGKKLYFYEDELLQWIESGRKPLQTLNLPCIKRGFKGRHCNYGASLKEMSRRR